MSGPIFVCDAQGTLLMPMAAAHARKLLQSGKAHVLPHHAFTMIKLSHTIAHPEVRPVILGIAIHLHTAELFLLAEGEHAVFPLLSVILDLRTDLSWRLRRRATHRRRRRQRGRYRPARRYGRPFKLRRPSCARSRRAHRMHRRSRRLSGNTRFTPIIRWRAEAIERAISVLCTLAPVSDIVLLAPRNVASSGGFVSSNIDRRSELIEHYGQVTADGTRRAMCVYCGTTEGRIEVDHIIPRSRGGTDRLSNLVLACAACNARSRPGQFTCSG